MYCFCRQFAHGEMVACDDAECEFEWFHFACVGLTKQPRGRWLCPRCNATATERRRAKAGGSAHLLGGHGSPMSGHGGSPMGGYLGDGSPHALGGGGGRLGGMACPACKGKHVAHVCGKRGKSALARSRATAAAAAAAAAPPRALVATRAVGALHPLAGEGVDFASPAEYCAWRDDHAARAAELAAAFPRRALAPPGAPRVALLLYRKHVVTRQPYVGELVWRLEAAGLCPVPIFIKQK